MHLGDFKLYNFSINFSVLKTIKSKLIKWLETYLFKFKKSLTPNLIISFDFTNEKLRHCLFSKNNESTIHTYYV